MSTSSLERKIVIYMYVKLQMNQPGQRFIYF